MCKTVYLFFKNWKQFFGKFLSLFMRNHVYIYIFENIREFLSLKYLREKKPIYLYLFRLPRFSCGVHYSYTEEIHIFIENNS